MPLILLIFLLVGCASPLKLQKKTNGDGYTLKELSSNRHFDVLVFLPSDVNNDTKLNYGRLAVIEESLVRGFFVSIPFNSAPSISSIVVFFISHWHGVTYL